MKKFIFYLFSLLLIFPLNCIAQTQEVFPRFYSKAKIPKTLPRVEFELAFPGQFPINYSEYGTFACPFDPQSTYKIHDLDGLKNATPQGIYPNQKLVEKDPAYKELKKQKRIEKDPWKIFASEDNQASFFSWALTEKEKPGIQAYFTAQTLEKSGNLFAALSAYEAILVFYPREFSYDGSGNYIWYLSAAALADIRRILRDYPQLGYSYEGASVFIDRKNDNNHSNDIVQVVPGKWVKKSPNSVQNLRVIRKRGKGKVRLVQYENGHWQMLLNDKPFTVKGILYAPTKVGQGPLVSHDFSTQWMFSDINKNGLVDAPYDAWVDSNSNNKQDEDEPAIGDFKLLKDAGVNAIKLYHYPKKMTHYDPSWANKQLLRELYRNYGIRVIMGDFIGAYTIGSGANWAEGTNYKDPAQRAQMKELVRQLVLDFKDEEFLLMWVLGNENNMPSEAEVNATKTNASSHPIEYATFLNELAEMIHEIDPNHPVSMGNLETHLLDVYQKYAPEIDIAGINAYRGKNGFGLLWDEVKQVFDRPLLLTEYGSDAYFQDRGIDEKSQAEYLEGAERDIAYNQAGGAGAGNSIGGCVFEYLDEWWKDPNEAESRHQTKSQHGMPFSDGHGHEEWFGIVGQGSGQNSPFQRNLRQAYYTLKYFWTE